MARSRAKKDRMKLEKMGKFNPEMKRGSWGDIKPVERKTPTLQEKLNRKEKKYGRTYSQDDYKYA